MTNVLLVDDHASFRQAVAFLIDYQDDLRVVGQAGSLADAHHLLDGIEIDVCLLDIDLPDGDGTDLLPDLFHHTPGAAAIVLSGTPHRRDCARSIAAGAAGFVPKTAGLPEVITAIRKAARGEMLVTPQEALALTREAYRSEASRKAIQRALESLTPRELDVLKALARGMGNQAIADELSLTTATVRSHVVHLLRKLDVDSRLQAALLAVHHGLVSPESTP